MLVVSGTVMSWKGIPGYYILALPLFAVTVLAFACMPVPFERLRKIFAALGGIAYPFYLAQGESFRLGDIAAAAVGTEAANARLAAALLCDVILAYLLYILVEKPIADILQKRLAARRISHSDP